MPRLALPSRAVLLAASFAVVAPLGAQQPPPPPPPAAQVPARAASDSLALLSGFAFDSIHGGPLAGATIRLSGKVERVGRTGVNGQFLIDSIVPGQFTLELLHPLLDTLGISLRSPQVELAAGQQASVDLAIPSPRRVVELSCSPAFRARGPSALVGRVLDADSDKPLPGASVELVWQELSLTSLRMEPRLRRATVGADGVYRICGLPATMEATLLATFQGQKTAEIKVAFDETSPLSFQSMRIGSTNVVAAAPDSVRGATGAASAAARGEAETVRSGNARLSGRVVNAAGQPVNGARVNVTGTAAAALTNERGEFSLANLPSGTQELVVRQLGFAPVEQPIELSARDARNVTVTMKNPARVLTEVTVTAPKAAEGLEKVGFNQRQKAGFGYFMDSEDVEKRQAMRITDLLRTIPSLKVVPQGMDYVVQGARDAQGGCVRYVLDGASYESLFPGDIDRMMPPMEVAAVEVYTSSNVPAQFQQVGRGSGCTVIVMWSKFKMGK